MIGRILFTLLWLVMGTILGLLMLRDSGYVLIEYDGNTLESSFWGALFGLVLLLGILTAVYRALKTLLRSSSWFSSWRNRRRSNKALLYTREAIKYEARGESRTAINLLENAAQTLEVPTLHYLYGAQLASRYGDDEKRDELLTKAALDVDQESLSTFKKAEMLFASGDHLGTLDLASDIEGNFPKSDAATALILHARVELEDWPAVQDTLNTMKGNALLQKEERDALLIRSWVQRLNYETPSSAKELWSTIPKTIQRDKAVLLSYVEVLKKLGEDEQAVELITAAVNREWDRDFVHIFGELAGDSIKQLNLAKRWLSSHADSPELLMALASLATRTDDHRGAREFLETCLRLQPSAGVYRALALNCMEGGEADRAREYLKLALESSPSEHSKALAEA